MGSGLDDEPDGSSYILLLWVNDYEGNGNIDDKCNTTVQHFQIRQVESKEHSRGTQSLDQDIMRFTTIRLRIDSLVCYSQLHQSNCDSQPVSQRNGKTRF